MKPEAYIEPGYPDVMPHIYGGQLSAKQLADLVQYLAAGS